MDFGVSLGVYDVAKLWKVANNFVFALGHIMSGHTLKHVAASSAYWFLRMLRLRTPHRPRLHLTILSHQSSLRCCLLRLLCFLCLLHFLCFASPRLTINRSRDTIRRGDF